MSDILRTENFSASSSECSGSVFYCKLVLTVSITGNEIHSVRSNHRQLLLNIKSNLELLQEFAHKLQFFLHLHIQRLNVRDDERDGVDGGIRMKGEALEADL